MKGRLNRGVKDIAFSYDASFSVSVGDNNFIKLFNTRDIVADYSDGDKRSPGTTYTSDGVVTTVDLANKDTQFISGGEKVHLWDIERSTPITEFGWGFDTVLKTRINPVETHVVLCTAIDRGIYLHDTRLKSNLAKIYMPNKSSSICWNPMEPFNFIAGNEDGAVYSYDMRNMEAARMIHKGHMGAV